MYDLNLSVPNLTSPKYSFDNKFLLLKNYLYELNETLSFALDDKVQSVVEPLEKSFKEAENKGSTEITTLKSSNVTKLNRIKEDILRTADEIEKSYKAEIEKTQKDITQSVSSSYVAKSDFGEYQNNMDTRLKQTDENISLNSQSTENVENDLNSFKNSARSEISVTADEVLSRVQSEFISKEEGEELRGEISSSVTQTESNITEAFNESLNKIENDVSSVGGQVTELITSLDVYIRRGELENGIYGIEIGRSDSSIKARFTNDKLTFLQGSTEIAYLSGTTLFITTAHILDYLKLGNTSDGFFLFDTTDNGMEVRWVNGN